MMGPRQEAQPALFYEFFLDDHVPQDHLLRSVDRFVDLSSIRAYLAEFYSHTGRPSVDPELLIRMRLVGYCFGIRLERRVYEEVHLNLAYRWFCRLDLSDRAPDHSTFSKNRHGRFRESELLRHLFEVTVARCIAEGLVSGKRMAVDASLIEADANKQNSMPQEKWDAARIDPADAPRAVREYLDTLDEAAFGAASEVRPKLASHSAPASQWTEARKGPAFCSYSDNYLIDTDHGVIVDVAETRLIRQAEAGSTKTMLKRVKETFDLHPERLIADTAYGTGPMLGWLVERKIEPHIPVFVGPLRDGPKGLETNAAVAIQPGKIDRSPRGKGHELTQFRRNYSDPNRGPTAKGVAKYRGLKLTCQSCPSKPRCCPNMDFRSITRDIAKTEQYDVSMKLRKKVEMLFAHLKRILGLGRLRLRGPCGAKDEFLLAATAQNLKKLAKILPAPQQPKKA
ncbi:IS1182 family transposase [Rhodovulum sulfidophilum]|uniref:IS1182 family transposase n=1 Tax=Rhodovulum sulfidophilum TaxID=35806 RepID=UPI0019246AC0|nr:IS1182 family transposase [Rhodovulum sulfidophilum]MBL3576210.1 IS1182 family transposase [Rhodovulum sulfidophilum]MCE8431592.1 IS1182 family transposase [Rhodovulum sulfidophilum]MCF4117278.1 IS1182 family transposase [Rhodovulum sulfidophilum]